MKKDPSGPHEPGLSTELDAVVAKAMRKDQQQRYGSAQDLAHDISRYLGGLTVLARRGSLRYSVTKFTGRNKLAAASVLTVLTLIVPGVSAITWQAQVAIRERETAKAVNDFLQNDLLAVEQGKDDQAESLLTALLEIRRHAPSLGQGGMSSLSSLSHTAGVLELLGNRLRQHRYSEAAAALREALEGRGKDEPKSWQKYEIQSVLGASLMAQRRFEQAEPLLLSAYQALTLHQHEILWESRSAVKQTSHRIIQLYQSWDKPDKAEAWRREHPSAIL